MASLEDRIEIEQARLGSVGPVVCFAEDSCFSYGALAAIALGAEMAAFASLMPATMC